MKHEITPARAPRDYRWLKDSPDLVPGGYRIPWGPMDAPAAKDLVSFMSQRSRPLLGQYFENLLAFALERDSRISDLVRNIQVSAGNRTVGEFDFLFRRRDMACHLEVAVKFYLGHGDLSRPENWLGPNCHDRLSLKLDKMFHKQLRLSQTPAGRDCLTQLGYGEVTPRHLVKGMLFYPHEAWTGAAFTCPDGIHPAHLRGWWCPAGRAQEVLETADHWTILEKPHWLSVGRRVTAADILSPGNLRSRLEKYFSRTKSPLLVAALADSADPDVTPCPERHRGFITPPGWPYPTA